MNNLIMLKIKDILLQRNSILLQVLSWIFSTVIMFTFIYVCEVTGM
jgi:hypothetical protein